MGHLHLDKLTPGNIAVFIGAVVLAWLLYKATKHLILGLMCLTVALAGAAYATGVLTPEKAITAARMVGQEGLQAAELGAKKLEEKAKEKADTP